MKPAIQRLKRPANRMHPGFALVVTLSLMILLTVIAVGLLSLSAVSLRSTSQGMMQAEARANARLALMLALGELQKEMGPDMRVSAESALFDQNKNTEEIEGVAQSHWLASYSAWGDWLNASYSPPDGDGRLEISDTYTPRREKMFRRWLLSLPLGMKNMINAPDSLASWNDSNSVVLVGVGSLGNNARPNQITRAHLTPVGKTGRHAWWIGPENHKARIDMAKNPRNLEADGWEISQGNTAEVGVGSLAGFEALDDNETLGDRLITTQSLRLARVEDAKVKEHFFDLTAHSQGVLASVRSGHLKKDLSLLFENNNSALPAPYKFNPSDIQEPSIRPMSPDLQAKKPTIPNRHFASWTSMRHFYRMYRDSDATVDGTGGAGSLNWTGSKPSTDVVCTNRADSAAGWNGSNAYFRVPVLAKVTFIHSLQTKPSANNKKKGQYDCYLVYTPVFTFWNPYNTELRIPDNTFGMMSSPYKILPLRRQLYRGNIVQGSPSNNVGGGNVHAFLRSANGSDLVFKPGEIRLFSHDYLGANTFREELKPGFNPMAIGGATIRVGTYKPEQNPGVAIGFSHSNWGGNVNFGSTPGSLCLTPDWMGNRNRMPLMYQNDWFNLAQTYTPISPPGVANIARWVFSDSEPVPYAYHQLVIKGLSDFAYDSIDWEQDWRSRNWIQSPPYYFGNSLYISEDDTIAHTQRLDNPYVMNFGPMSSSEMPKVVGHIGDRAFLGSGAGPFEKVTSVAALELPTAPIASLAGFAGMRIKPGWTDPGKLNPDLKLGSSGGNNTSEASFYGTKVKALAYQSGVTGPGIGNSFMHPMLPRNDVYQYLNNSVSQDPSDRRAPLDNIKQNDNKVFNDYWDHVFLLNDALWDDYFVSSLADQTRPGASSARSLSKNFERLVEGLPISNTRYRYHSRGDSAAAAKAELQGAEGYLKTAKHLVIDGMFNVNSTSVAAWHALFAGIRERQLVYRDRRGALREIDIPSGKRIAISRFNTAVSDKEMDDPEYGVTLPDGSSGWSGVRFLDDDQLTKLAEECVKQVKQRGPFLNFSEFINRRLSNDQLGLMGALQSAIDYDDKSPESGSINYLFKNGPDFMLKKSSLGRHAFATPEAAEGSRFAGIPGYVIQSDLLKPIANTMSVRDDTFRIRAYGEALDASGKVTARAWCEAVVQRMPEYQDPANDADVPARLLDTSGTFSDNSALSDSNRRFGRKFHIESFRWLSADEV